MHAAAHISSACNPGASWVPGSAQPVSPAPDLFQASPLGLNPHHRHEGQSAGRPQSMANAVHATSWSYTLLPVQAKQAQSDQRMGEPFIVVSEDW